MAATNAEGMLSSFVSLFRRTPSEGEDEEHPLELKAVPGLMTLLDVALFRSVEAELTATVASGNALLCAWLSVKRQAQLLLSTRITEATHNMEVTSPSHAFARVCLESAMDALERLNTDPLASSANLTDAYESFATHQSYNSGNAPSPISNIEQGVAKSSFDTGRRRPLPQRPRDCWETSRLLCPDHVWADEALQTCQRHVRHLSKHPYMTSTNSSGEKARVGTSMEQRHAQALRLLVQCDLPMRLHHFRAAIENDGVVAKRLYLVKCEYRAPFRAFLEGHQAVQRAPSLEIVQDFQQLQTNYNKLTRKRSQAESNLQGLLETPELVEALSLEQECETMEVRMGQALFCFTELARILDQKRAKLRAIPGVVEPDDVGVLLETLRKLKYLLCRKTSSETSSGIRPLLLDLQGVQRDETPCEGAQPSNNTEDEKLLSMLGRLKELLRQLDLLGRLCTVRGAFAADNKRGEVDLPSNIVKSCSVFDHELFAALCEDWYTLVKRQHELVGEFVDLSERIRRAEMEVSISRASESSLGVVRQRLEMIAQDRQKRFDILKEMIEEVCVREMNLHVKLMPPKKAVVLELARTSASGVFGTPLMLAGEELPLG